METKKSAYICGPLTELPPEEREEIKLFYETIAHTFEEVMGVEAFIPHKHYDPVEHADFTPAQVDAVERAQVCERTSILIVVAVAPSWGGGIEVEMANRSGVPVLVLCESAKLRDRKISRLLRGNPAVVDIVSYASKEDALNQLRLKLKSLHLKKE